MDSAYLFYIGVFVYKAYFVAIMFADWLKKYLQEKEKNKKVLFNISDTISEIIIMKYTLKNLFLKHLVYYCTLLL